MACGSIEIRNPVLGLNGANLLKVIGMSRTAKVTIISVLIVLTMPVLLSPPDATMATEKIFDDPALLRAAEYGNDSTTSEQLIVRISHNDKGQLSNNLSRVQQLLTIESLARMEGESNYSLDHDEVYIKRLESPVSSWEKAFKTRDKSLANSSSWGEVLQPINEQGWCGENANTAEVNALQATLLMLPKGSNLGVACPDFAGSSASQPPQSNEIIWLVWLDSSKKPVDWLALNEWCEKLTINSPFEFEPAGVNMLFKEAEQVAKQDLANILPLTVIILFALMLIFFRDVKVTILTLSSVIFVIAAVAGLLQILGYQFSVIDGIAIPIIMGVAVDGAFWYRSSKKSKHEVREILLLAMATTVAAISLALFSPIKAQRGLALVMIVGILIDWILTRYVLEDFYLALRKIEPDIKPQILDTANSKKWLWPLSLVLLVLVAATAPPGVETLDIEQFLPEDSDSLDELSELRDVYVIASGTVVIITMDINPNDEDSINNLLRFKSQFLQHPNIISYDTGITQQKLILGIGDTTTSNFTALFENTTDSVILQDPWLRSDGVINGGIIMAIIDGEDSESAYQFSIDTNNLIADNNLSGEIGGQLITGISLAKSFEQTRIIQIIAAGLVVLIIGLGMTRSFDKSIRIAIGTIAVGIAVDGLASHFGGRGVNTAPAVLIGMGFAADYLSHASKKTRSLIAENYARWGAALTSGTVFFAVSFSQFPPAKNTGILLSATILISVILATCLAFMYSNSSSSQEE